MADPRRVNTNVAVERARFRIDTARSRHRCRARWRAERARRVGTTRSGPDGVALNRAFWGSRYCVVEGPGPLVVGIMSVADPARRRPSPELSDFA